MSVKLKTPSNGSVTLAPADTASDVVVTVPAGTSTMVTNATLPTQLNASGDAPIYACRAWVNFNGTTSPGTIRASGNVSSVTRNSTGTYTVNFTTSMPDANYSCVALATDGQSIGIDDSRCFVSLPFGSYSTSSVYIGVTNSAATAFQNANTVNVSIFR